MNKKISFFLSLILCFCLLDYVFGSDIEKLLKPADVEKVTGIKGIKLIPRNPVIGAGGDLNFTKEDNTLLLIVAVQDSSMYNKWKSEEGFFHALVPKIGDEAFEGPTDGEHRYILIFKKKKSAVSLSSFFDLNAGGKPYINQEQLRELAKILISRL